MKLIDLLFRALWLFNVLASVVSGIVAVIALFMWLGGDGGLLLPVATLALCVAFAYEAREIYPFRRGGS